MWSGMGILYRALHQQLLQCLSCFKYPQALVFPFRRGRWRTWRQDMMSPWLLGRCYGKHCVQHMVCSIVFSPQLPSTFAFTMTKQYPEKKNILVIFESPVRTNLLIELNNSCFLQNHCFVFLKIIYCSSLFPWVLLYLSFLYFTK